MRVHERRRHPNRRRRLVGSCVVKTLAADTDPRAEAVMIERLRRMTPAARLHRAFELRTAALTLARARIRRQYGALSEREITIRLAALWLDGETMRKVYGWDPRREGY